MSFWKEHPARCGVGLSNEAMEQRSLMASTVATEAAAAEVQLSRMHFEGASDSLDLTTSCRSAAAAIVEADLL